MRSLNDAVDWTLVRAHVIQSVVRVDRVGVRRCPSAVSRARKSNARNAWRTLYLAGQSSADAQTCDGDCADRNREFLTHLHLRIVVGRPICAPRITGIPAGYGYGAHMAVVLVTGMSGAGKSTALVALARRGHRVVDTDYGGWIAEVPSLGGRTAERLWREDRIEALLGGPHDGALFVSGCVANQRKFYPRFDAVVLLSAPAEVILERVAVRENNDYGKSHVQRDRILHDLASVEPLLRAGATAEIDTRAPLGDVVDALERIACCGMVSVSPDAARIAIRTPP
jgi:hypothetical protein